MGLKDNMEINDYIESRDIKLKDNVNFLMKDITVNDKMEKKILAGISSPGRNNHSIKFKPSIAACLAAALVITCIPAAAYAYNAWHNLDIEERYNVSPERVTELMENNAVSEENISVTANGITFETVNTVAAGELASVLMKISFSGEASPVLDNIPVNDETDYSCIHFGKTDVTDGCTQSYGTVRNKDGNYIVDLENKVLYYQFLFCRGEDLTMIDTPSVNDDASTKNDTGWDGSDINLALTDLLLYNKKTGEDKTLASGEWQMSIPVTSTTEHCVYENLCKSDSDPEIEISKIYITPFLIYTSFKYNETVEEEYNPHKLPESAPMPVAYETADGTIKKLIYATAGTFYGIKDSKIVSGTPVDTSTWISAAVPYRALLTPGDIKAVYYGNYDEDYAFNGNDSYDLDKYPCQKVELLK